MDSDIKRNIIEHRIKHYRLTNGYTQAQMAELLNVKVSTYSLWERRGLDGLELLIKFAKVLDVDIRLLLYGDVPDDKSYIV